MSLKTDLETVDAATSLTTGGIVDIAHTALHLKTKAAKEFLRVAMANAILMDRKQQDYGPGNISSFGMFGVVVRMNDKMERLKTLLGKGKRRRASNEPITDTFRDISNYGSIALMLDLERWPNES